ncbi:MAG: CBS domain-containing protein, partial [Burkholderiales bacterium]
MKAKDIMTTPVVTIAPDTTVREIAELLLERRISGVPVVEGGRLVGLVSEGDLLHRHELGTDRERPARSWWLRLISGE